ncbi:hypothetical protein ACFE04_005141 [Oxalis oulophora]
MINKKAATRFIRLPCNRPQLLLKAMKNSTDKKWFAKYGPISKFSLLGYQLVSSADKLQINSLSESMRMILGDRNLVEQSEEHHKYVKNALIVYVNPESLKWYVGQMDEEIRNHFDIQWKGKQRV